jgi:hypothetical protein
MKIQKTNLGNLSVFSGILAIGLTIIVHLINPEIDPSWQPISEMALGNNGLLMNIAFLSMALSIAFFLLQSRKCYTNLGGKIGKIILAISAIGFLSAGFFNTDPSILPQEQATTSGFIHSLGAGLAGLLPFSALFFTWVFIKNTKYKMYKIPILLVTILLWISEVNLMVDMATELPKNNGNLGPNVLVGWSNRIMILFSLLWIIIISIQTKKYKNGQA